MQQRNTKNKMLKVAILGKLPSKMYAPFDDPEWEIWTCNKHKIPRFTRWFDIHKNPSLYDNDINEKLITLDKYPLEEVIDLLGGYYLNNSISYMIMYGVLLNASEIRLYGVALNNDHEIRTHQRQGTREICMFARGRGIKVWSYEPTLLEEYPLYC